MGIETVRAFLITDIEGSSRLWETSPAEMSESLLLHNAIISEAVASHGGRVFKTAGDSICAAFDCPSDALAAAVEAQSRLESTNWSLPESIRVRMGIHVGVAEERDNDFFGSTINRTARLAGAGHGGQILMSADACDQLNGSANEGVALKDLGQHRLRDLIHPQRICQVVAPDLPSEFPPLRTIDSLPNNLPKQVNAFIGRERELDEVNQLVRRYRLVTILGSGGAGKTRLALEAAAELIERFPDGVWVVDLSTVTDPDQIACAITTELALRQDGGLTLEDSLVRYIGSSTTLLVLDNCEHVIEAAAGLVERLLQSCPNLKVLATSRESLGIVGETAWRIPSLSFPPQQDFKGFALRDLEQFESARLFLDRALITLPGLELSDSMAPAIAQICSRLDGIPLAVELAAVRVRALSVEQIAQRLDDRFHLLTGGSRTALPRQQTLRATIDWSYGLLSEEERLFFRRLSVFLGGWSLEAAEQVASGDGVDEYAVIDLLGNLVDKSLVNVEERGPDGLRYAFTETIREYSRDRLMETDDMASLRRRHMVYYLGLAERGEAHIDGPGQAAWLPKLDHDYKNLRSAIEWALRNDGEASLTLVCLLWRYWMIRGMYHDGRKFTQKALDAVPEAPQWLRAKALNSLALLVQQQGDYRLAQALSEESLAIRTQLGDEQGMTFALASIGANALFVGDLEASQKIHEQTLELSKKSGNAWGMAQSEASLGLISWYRGDYEKAREGFESSLARWSELGDLVNYQYALVGLGLVAWQEGDLEKSISLLRKALKSSRDLGNKMGTAQALNVLGIVLLNAGELEEAETWLIEGLELSEKLDAKWLIGLACGGIGWLKLQQGDAKAARQYVSRSLALRVQVEDRWGALLSLDGLAFMAALSGRPEISVQIFGFTDAGRADMGALRLKTDVRNYDEIYASIRSALGDGEFDRLYAEGGKMTMDQAVKLANEGW
ncbi:MAG: tetratricopeptide repeat protein [Armatimonadetes bacterium]|nr:tetratricopeptide repeat protein [Armatimonadota bacterium]